MIVNATADGIKSIISRSFKKDKLNILTSCAHERYEQNLCKTGHNFYSLIDTKKWDTDYGKIPDNYFLIENLPKYLEFDLILAHTGVFPYINGVPIIRHNHVLPDIRYDKELQKKYLRSPSHLVSKYSFISEYSMNEWGFYNNEGAVIEHGIDTDFWSPDPSVERHNVCLSVVNDWPNRDWCCGWELWKNIVSLPNGDFLPYRVFGKNPGLSEAAKSEEHLKEIYTTSSIFLNTSLHSPVPTVLMEAMSCGCAIVSTENCMIPEIIKHGVNGLLSNDPKELSSYIQLLLNDKDYARELGKRARETIIKKFNITKFVNNWNNLFYSLIYGEK